jgi:DNA-binding transcriptional MerR regulator/methylmalonyl-CoA mutase cobalamin-binding subunit
MYTIKEASARSGVGIPLLRAWERRYGVVAPTRTPSGYRLYDEAAIDRLRAMRQLIADGWSAQQAAQRVLDSSAEELAVLAHPIVPAGTVSEPAEATERAAIDLSAADTLIARLLAAARSLDGAELEAALDETFGAARFEVAAERVVMPALRAIGDAWERGEVSVAGEHAASHAVLRRLAMAYEAAAAADAGRPVLVGMGPGSRHELGALAFAVAARRTGLPVLYLGPDLPPDSWTAAATGRDARAAVIGVPTRNDARRANEVFAALREACPDIVLAAGGREAGRVAGAWGALVLPESLFDAVGELRGHLERGASPAGSPGV